MPTPEPRGILRAVNLTDRPLAVRSAGKTLLDALAPGAAMSLRLKPGDQEIALNDGDTPVAAEVVSVSAAAPVDIIVHHDGNGFKETLVTGTPALGPTGKVAVRAVNLSDSPGLKITLNGQPWVTGLDPRTASAPMATEVGDLDFSLGVGAPVTVTAGPEESYLVAFWTTRDVPYLKVVRLSSRRLPTQAAPTAR